MNLTLAIKTIREQLSKHADWQRTAIFTVEAVQALLDDVELHTDKSNPPPTDNYYD